MRLFFVVSFFSNVIHVGFRFLLLSLSYDYLKVQLFIGKKTMKFNYLLFFTHVDRWCCGIDIHIYYE
jgi:hypothetical protein